MESFNNALLSSPIYWIIIIICLIIIVFNKRISAFIIGKAGEFWVKGELKHLSNDYIVINDIMINPDGYTHQIDHVVISKYGIFVIETKQYNGYITGSKYDKKWVRHIGKQKIYYTNPILQNYGHIKSISELLHIEENKILNIVCIPSNAKLNIKDDGETVRINTLVDTISSHKDIIIDNPRELANIIKNNNIVDKKKRKQHIEYNRSKKENITSNMCPKCGGILIKRTGKKGEFYGCSNYPRCKYTRN